MTTSQKRAANRRNAQHSTGPRSQAGKRVASRNALRHGLSATSLLPNDPRLQNLQALIQDEVADDALARLIAGKILDYELTEAQLLQAAHQEASGLNGYVDQETLNQARSSLMAKAELIEDLQQEKCLPGLTKAEKQVIANMQSVAKFLARFYGQQEQIILRQAHTNSTRLRRYFKRASNQMIKALKGLPTVG